MLTDTEIRKAKPEAKAKRMFDGRGLYLEVSPAGGKWWRLKYRFGGKEKRLSLGTYPDTTLAEARDKREAARKLLAADVDPSEQRKAEKAANTERAANSFEALAREWFAKRKRGWAENHSSKIFRRLEKDIFPWIGGRPINDITPPELLKVLRRIESRGALETAHRARATCGQVFRYAVATGRAERDPAADLQGALESVPKNHLASITDPKAIGELLRAIEGYQGDYATRYALKLAPLVFTRPGELRGAEWSEIDLEAAEWRIPAERMKMKAVHIVPLASQSVEILRELHAISGARRFVFPSVRSPRRCMSENTITAALRRLGYSGKEMTGHGFRSMASTRLNEMGWNRDAIERQLAHAERDPVRAAYNYAEHLPERRRMMQAWADYLDGLKEGATVTPIRAGLSA